MTFEPIAAQLAVELARQTAGSARPHAPVQPDPVPRGPRLSAARARLATDLRAVARWVEPKARPAKVCQTG